MRVNSGFQLLGVSVLALFGLSVFAPAATAAPIGATTANRTLNQSVLFASTGQLSKVSSTQESFLSGVSCSDLSTCIAVGARSTHRATDQTLIESWNGSAWSILPSPNTSPTQSNQLSAVSCTSPSACTAVGSYTTTSSQALIESWNGSTWSIVPSPGVPSSQANLEGVSCSSPSACTAVGSYTTNSSQALIESWNGSTWSMVPSPNVPDSQANNLEGVSCSSPSACTAVGTYFESFFQVPNQLIESWNGIAWSVTNNPNNNPVAASNLDGVVCAPSACFAVGSDRYSGIDQTLIEGWTGAAWSIVPSPNPSPSQADNLAGVACTSPSACAAVGEYFNGSGVQPLAESWNGSAWSIVPSATTASAQQDMLQQVSCSGPSACTAVGSYSTSTSIQTLIESWDGTKWSVVPSPNANTPVTITTSSLAGAFTGNAYSATLSASGGIPPYTWRLVSGSKLPKGLKLSRSGVISGTPKRTGTFSFTVHVRTPPDLQTQNTAEATLSISVS
jgi:hypothetical protein